MSEWKIKRFWKDATIQKGDAGFSVLLDGRSIKTPAKAQLIVPTAGLAEAVANEWRAVVEDVDPRVMPYTRSSNAAIDKVSTQFDEVSEIIAAYADSDLLCYRADSPVELRRRQDAVWDGVLDLARTSYGLELKVHEGVMYQPQPEASLGLARELTNKMTPFQLTAFHDLVSMSGSFVIGLAAAAGWEPAEKLWEISRIDETWQEDLWGKDDEATETAAIKEVAFRHACLFYALSENM